jgi:hypothetical protein
VPNATEHIDNQCAAERPEAPREGFTGINILKI